MGQIVPFIAALLIRRAAPLTLRTSRHCEAVASWKPTTCPTVYQCCKNEGFRNFCLSIRASLRLPHSYWSCWPLCSWKYQLSEPAELSNGWQRPSGSARLGMILNCALQRRRPILFRVRRCSDPGLRLIRPHSTGLLLPLIMTRTIRALLRLAGLSDYPQSDLPRSSGQSDPQECRSSGFGRFRLNRPHPSMRSSTSPR